MRPFSKPVTPPELTSQADLSAMTEVYGVSEAHRDLQVARNNQVSRLLSMLMEE